MNDEQIQKLYSNCTLCPRRCGADRTRPGSFGRCGAGTASCVNLAMLHYGEEPVISGTRGSGTVFFEGCPLGCIFCQNSAISGRRVNRAHEMSTDDLAKTFLDLQAKGAHNINLVTPMHYAPSVAAALRSVRPSELRIPVIVNTGGYELTDTLQLMDGLVDIYMPDLKFFSQDISRETCNAPDYFDRACEALDEMYRQVGPVVLDDDGMLVRGMIIRHLMLPGRLFDTKKVLDHIAERYGSNVYISLMSQYTPMPTLPEHAPSYLKKTVLPEHYEAAVRHLGLMLDNCDRVFTQDKASSGDDMIPDFR